MTQSKGRLVGGNRCFSTSEVAVWQLLALMDCIDGFYKWFACNALMVRTLKPAVQMARMQLPTLSPFSWNFNCNVSMFQCLLHELCGFHAVHGLS